jgi:predicted deacylase
MIQTYTYNALAPGPRILIFGAIHGNELCGPRAIERVMKELQTGKLVLKKGSVQFVPVCNPLAYKKGVRLVEENLNRIFKPTRNPRSYEAKLANTLCGMVDSADALLDIHSTTAKGIPFMYLDFPTPRNRAWAKVLGPQAAVVGWPELYATLGSAHTSFDTTTYAHNQGKDTLLVECGQHKASTATRMAYAAIRNTLVRYGLTEGTLQAKQPLMAKIDQAFFRNEGEELAHKHWKHLDVVKKGEPLIRTKTSSIPAPHDGYVVMPKHNAPVGHDWLYFGRKL